MSTTYSLVTGAAGGIGCALCERLLNQGKHVIAIDNYITGTNKFDHPNLHFIESDIENLPPISEPIDNIYHLACPTGVPNLKKIPLEMLSTTSTGTRNILDLAIQKNARYLLASSSEVYGDPLISPQTTSYTGNVDPIGMRSPYEEGKRFSEALTMAYIRYRGLDGKIARIFNTFGPTFPKIDTRVITHFTQCAKQNQPLHVHGDGSQKRTFLYVDDCVRGLMLILDQGASGSAYNIGSQTQTTIKDLADLIIKTNNSTSTIEYIERPPHDHQERLPDLTALHALGWQQTFSLEEGLRLTAQ